MHIQQKKTMCFIICMFRPLQISQLYLVSFITSKIIVKIYLKAKGKGQRQGQRQRASEREHKSNALHASKGFKKRFQCHAKKTLIRLDIYRL